MNHKRVFRKNCVFSQFTATPPLPTSLYKTFNPTDSIKTDKINYSYLKSSQTGTRELRRDIKACSQSY